MKIAWLINIVMPELAVELGLWKTSLGGWLIGQMNGLRKTGYQLTIISVTSEVKRETWKSIQGIEYCVLPEYKDDELKRAFKGILDKLNPDVFHIFGTESHAAALAFEASNPLNTVVSIQGLVSVCSQHVKDGIPEKYYKSTLLKRIGKKAFHGSIIEDDAIRLMKRGEKEKRILRAAKHIIGRTTWDRANVFHINQDANYYVCREILRGSFYDEKWNYNECEKHTIFLSQCASPIKGLHQVLKAMPLILQKYPDTVINIAGKPLSSVPGRNSIKQAVVEYFCGYQGYIEKLVRDNNLYENICFLNYLNEEQMREQYLKANVFVLPSSIENSPNSLGEAMLLGVPCVASCVGGVPDMLKAPEEGYIYPFEEPYMLAYYVCKVFEAEERISEISERARRHAALTHNIEMNTTDLITVYEKIGNKNNGTIS